MISTVITFSKADVQAPVFVAGAFTDWAPVEMNCETVEEDGIVRNKFTYTASLEPGEYQYKFRLGPGDWWTLDESMPTAADNSGNVNNVLSVELEEPVTPERVSEPKVRVLNTEDAYILDEEPEVPEEPPMKEIIATNETSEVPIPAQEIPTPAVIELTPQTPAQETADEPLKEEGLEAITIPEIAPPPYSLEEKPVIATPSMGAAAPEKLSVPSGVIQSQSESKASEQSWISRMCGGNVWLVAAIVAVPIAVGLYRYR